MVSIQLKAKHLFYVAAITKGIVMSEYFRLANAVKSQLDANYETDDTLITVEATPREIISVFSILASMPEGQVNQINTEMLTLLTPQLQAGVGSQESEWIEIATEIQNSRASHKVEGVYKKPKVQTSRLSPKSSQNWTRPRNLKFDVPG